MIRESHGYLQAKNNPSGMYGATSPGSSSEQTSPMPLTQYRFHGVGSSLVKPLSLHPPPIQPRAPLRPAALAPSPPEAHKSLPTSPKMSQHSPEVSPQTSPPNLSSPEEAAHAFASHTISPFPKHWIWNTASLFYATGSRDQLPPHAFLPYAAHFNGLPISPAALHLDTQGSEHKSHDTSDDSLDQEETTKSQSSGVAKKRNPYSIEELLKKPEKKRRFSGCDPIICTSLPPSKPVVIALDDTSRLSGTSSTHLAPDEEAMADKACHIEVCD